MTILFSHFAFTFWFLVNADGSSLPPCNLQDLMNDIASTIPSKWRSVGIQLALPSGTLDSIQTENTGKPQACRDSFEQVFSIWEKQSPKLYNWKTIIDVLRTPEVGEFALANKLDALYVKSKQAKISQPTAHSSTHQAII